MAKWVLISVVVVTLSLLAIAITHTRLTHPTSSPFTSHFTTGTAP